MRSRITNCRGVIPVDCLNTREKWKGLGSANSVSVWIDRLRCFLLGVGRAAGVLYQPTARRLMSLMIGGSPGARVVLSARRVDRLQSLANEFFSGSAVSKVCLSGGGTAPIMPGVVRQMCSAFRVHELHSGAHNGRRGSTRSGTRRDLQLE